MRTLAKRLVEQRAYHSATRLVVLSEAFSDILVQEFSVPEERVAVIPGGVDTRTFHPASSPQRRPHTVLSVRRLERRMGLDVLIDAWPEVVRALPTARLRIAGEGPELFSLQTQVRELGLRESVDFLGALAERRLVQEYQQATVSVVPSVALEGFGLVALESLACGTPVVASRVGGIPSILSRVDEQALVPPADSRSLAAALLRALSGTRPSSRSCVDLALQYSWDDVATSHLALYEDL
jgi:glycosyltransferase involved in cell wall biosynthesis